MKYFDDEDYYTNDYRKLSLDELENQIKRDIDGIINASGIKKAMVKIITNDVIKDMIKEFNQRCPAYDIEYNEAGVKRNYRNKKFTGTYNGKKYYNGIEIIEEETELEGGSNNKKIK